MATVLRVTAEWTGFSGAPGFTNLHFRDFGTGEGPGTDGDATQAQAAVTGVRNYFDAIKGLLPTQVKVQVRGVVDSLNVENGVLEDSFTVPNPLVITGTGNALWAGPVGAVTNLRTNGIRNGRRVRGRIFLVPLSGLAFDSTTGRLLPTAVTTLTTAAETLRTLGTPDLGVWARPTAPGAADGQWFIARTVGVPTIAAVLRSRRD